MDCGLLVGHLPNLCEAQEPISYIRNLAVNVWLNEDKVCHSSENNTLAMSHFLRVKRLGIL